MASVSQICATLQTGELPQRGSLFVNGNDGHEEAHEHRGQKTQAGHRQEGRAPAENLAQPGRRRDADHIGDAEAQDDPADRLSPSARTCELCGHQGGDAEIGPVGHAGEEAGGEQRKIGGRQGGGRIAQGEEHHQADQHGPTRRLGEQHGDQRRPDHDPQGVGADHIAAFGNRDPHAVRDAGQQAHGGEFARPDGEPAHGQGQFRQRGAMGRAKRRLLRLVVRSGRRGAILTAAFDCIIAPP